MLTDAIKVKGNLSVVLLDADGKLKDRRDVNNLVVTTGKGYIASRMGSNTAVIMSHMAAGDSNTSPVVGDTGLGSELGRVALDSTTVANATITYVATFPAGTATGTLAEAGIFNDGTSGTMLCRTNFNEVNKAAGDTIVITWNVTVS